MGLNNLFSATEIAGSGLTAERMRMEVAANNIANANSTRTTQGGAYRRQQVVFSNMMDESITRSGGAAQKQGLTGVKVVGIHADKTPLPRVYNPGHPDAGEDGHVELPNVTIPHEMIDMMTASRSYEANLKSLQIFRQMAEQSLNLMRGNG